MFRRFSSLYGKRFIPFSTSSSTIKFDLTMKKLVDSKQYQKALDLFQQQSEVRRTDNSITMALKACTKLHDYQRGINIQKQLSSNSLHNRFIQTSLIHFYMQCHDIENANRLFSTIIHKSNFTYGAMFKGFVSNKTPEKVLDLLDEMTIEPDKVTLTIIFNACAQVNNERAREVGNKLLNQMPNDFRNDIILINSTVTMLMRFGDVKNAEQFFQLIKKKDTVSYGAMMKGYVENDMCDKALDLFEQISVNSNDVIHAIIFSACAQLKNDRGKIVGKRLLDQILNKLEVDNVVINSAIHMLMRFGDVRSAEQLFESIKTKDSVSYGTMMKGYVENDMCEKVLDLLDQMSSNSNNVIHAIIFNACAQLSNDRGKIVGKRLLDQILNESEINNVVINSAIHMLMRFGDVERAEQLFELLKEKNTVSYGTMMKGYVENDMCEKVLDLLDQMSSNSNNVIHAIIFNACAQLSNDRAKNVGKRLLDQILNESEINNVVINSAIHMLMRFGDVERAEQLFELLKEKNTVSYGAMMNGYNINKKPFKCLELFEEMKEQDVALNEIIFVLLIGACSQIGIRSVCQSVVDKIPLHLYDKQRICNALIDMWGKAGLVGNAEQIFKTINNPDIITYSSMINAFGLNGRGPEAIDLYRQISTDLRDEVSHICVMNACSHSGLLDEARSIFNEINIKTEQITTTMVDCLSRLFVFDEAQNLIDDYEKTNSPYSAMYMAMLSGARNCRDSVVAEETFNRMKSLFPDQKTALISGSILLSNIYSSLGDYGRASNIKSDRRKEFGIKVKIGLTWTEVNGEIVEFKAHDQSHPRFEEIDAEMKRLEDELIEHGHKFDASWITRPINEDETVQSVLCGHSEKLALAYNFIARTKPSFIQITKNLRVCGDCHQATKLIAKIRQCEIIVRDANRIHHFYPNGQCSCQDHF